MPIARRAAVPGELVTSDPAESRGASVQRVLPTLDVPRLDPFVVLDEFRLEPGGHLCDERGRGFEGVTYLLDGSARVYDGRTTSTLLHAGDLHHATRAALSGEEPSLSTGSDAARGLRLRLNLPGRPDAFEGPAHQLRGGELPVHDVGESRVRKLVGPGSPIRTRTPIAYDDVALPAGAFHDCETAAGWNGLIYVLDGCVELGASVLEAGDAALLRPDASWASARRASRFVVLSGRPQGWSGTGALATASSADEL